MNYLHAYPDLGISGQIKLQSEHFIVEEQISFQPTGEGEHLFLWVEKRDSNTTWVSKQLARWAGVNAKKVYFGGLKDRYAITRQWFSIHLPGQLDPDPQQLQIENVQILRMTRHNRAFKSSALRGNHFKLVISQLHKQQQALSSTEQSELLKRLELIGQQGVPNYFGEQRFGIERGNLQIASTLFKGEFTGSQLDKRMAVSAARSELFNQILSSRIQQQNWQSYVTGDVCMLEGSKSFFTPTTDELPEIQQRLQQQDIHLTGYLFGIGDSKVSAQVATIEQQVLRQHPLFCSGLIEQKLPSERRSLRSKVSDLTYQFINNDLHLAFTLNAGCYATAVIRELLND